MPTERGLVGVLANFGAVLGKFIVTSKLSNTVFT